MPTPRGAILGAWEVFVPILTHLLERPVRDDECSSVQDWWALHLRLAGRWSGTVDLALAAGFEADRPGWAFASGYQAALRALFPKLPADRPAALCASEQGGGHPRAIRTRLAGGRLVGSKTFVTLGSFARLLLVIASEGEGADGRNRLRTVLLTPDRPGVVAKPGPGLPFVPEVPHAVLELDCAVDEAEVLPGDGYLDHLKPFRTIEDLHVHASLVGWLLRVGRDRWPPEVVEQGLTIAAAARGLEGTDPSAPATWRALGGLLEGADRWIAAIDAHLDRLAERDRRLWSRDRAILSVASRARTARLERARATAPRR